jgi:hypothetical protein
MLYPHSLLWHYLWVGPHVLQLVLAILLWRRGFHRQFPFFFTYLVYEGSEELTVWALDWLPGISDRAFWQTDCAGMAVEGLVKFAVVLEVFLHLVSSRPAVAKLGKRLIGCTGTALVALAALAAARAPITFRLPAVAYTHILGQSIFMIGCGLWLFVFLFAARFHLLWNSRDFGIALGASISVCVHLGTSAIFANRAWFERGFLLDFVNMGTYHLCVLIWLYYLLPPAHPSAAPINNGISPERKTNVPIRRAGQKLQPARLLARPRN